jgi:hypothetical protein
MELYWWCLQESIRWPNENISFHETGFTVPIDFIVVQYSATSRRVPKNSFCVVVRVT